MQIVFERGERMFEKKSDNVSGMKYHTSKHITEKLDKSTRNVPRNGIIVVVDAPNGSISDTVKVLSKPIYTFNKKTMKKNLLFNSSFRDIIMSGAYFYYNNRLCLRRPGCLQYTEKHVTFSKRVLANPDEYLLSFREESTISRKKTNSDNSNKGKRLRYRMGYRTDLINSSAILHAKKYYDKSSDNDNYSIENIKQSIIEKVSDFTDNLGPYFGNPPDDFCQFFSSLMKENNLSVKDLADLTEIDPRTINRMRTRADYRPSLEYIVACCIAMRLIYWDSERLIYLAGYTLRKNIKAESAYIGLLQAATQILTLDECDIVLKGMGVRTLHEFIQNQKRK